MLAPRKLVCALVALIVLAPPLMACALPGVQMSDEEKACCRHMADQCDGSVMPDSHSCCKQSTATQTGAFQIKQSYSPALEVASIPAVAPLPAPAVPVATMEKRILAFSESPPGLISVLRI